METIRAAQRRAERKKSPDARPGLRRTNEQRLSISPSKAIAKSAECPTRKSPADWRG
jgi:hypothetical protein